MEKEDFLKKSLVLSCFVLFKNVLFNLLCVLDLFSFSFFIFFSFSFQNAGNQLRVRFVSLRFLFLFFLSRFLSSSVVNQLLALTVSNILGLTF